MSNNIPYPTQDRVLLKRDNPEEKTSSGLFIPSTATEKPMVATVIAVGPGTRYLSEGEVRFLDVDSVKPGDRVLIPKFGTHEFKHNQEEYLLVKESEILAVL